MKESPCKNCKNADGRCRTSSAWCDKWGDWFAVEWREMVSSFTGKPIEPLGRDRYGYRDVIRRQAHGKKET